MLSTQKKETRFSSLVEGLIVFMHVWKTQPKPAFLPNRVDVLHDLIEELQARRQHGFKSESEIKLFESRMENVWVELNANHRMFEGRLVDVKPVGWKCGHCSVKRSGDYCLYCPFCQNNLFSERSIERKDFKTYFEHGGRIVQEQLLIVRCEGCFSRFIRPSK